jgi:rod shape determining protein RodA
MALREDDAILGAGKANRMRPIKQFDAVLFAQALTITAIGYYFVNITAKTYEYSDGGAAIVSRQLTAIVIGVVAALALSCFDYKYFRIPSYVAYIGSVLLLVAVRLSGAGDGRGLIQLPVFGQFQPSELTKITFVVVISTFLERIAKKEAKRMDYVKLAAYSCLPIGLIGLIGDMGTMIVFVFMLCCMIFVCGIQYRYVFAAAVAAIALLPVVWNFGLSDYQKMRFTIFLNPELSPDGYGMQILRARAAIGAGQLTGRQTADLSQQLFAKVPTRMSDFVFTAIAERVGFVGSVAFLMLVGSFLLRCYYIASQARDSYGAFMATGVTSMLSFHFIENIGMCLGLLPVTGIPLPFVSLGGTSVITSYMAVGIMMSVSMMREKRWMRRGRLIAMPPPA